MIHALLFLPFLVAADSSLTSAQWCAENPVLFVANQLFRDPQITAAAKSPENLICPDSIRNELNAFETTYFKNSTAMYDTSADDEIKIVNCKRNTMYKAIVALCGASSDAEASYVSKNAILVGEYNGDYNLAKIEIEYMEKYLRTNNNSGIKEYVYLFLLRRYFFALELIGDQDSLLLAQYKYRINEIKRLLLKNTSVLVRELTRTVLSNYKNVGF